MARGGSSELNEDSARTGTMEGTVAAVLEARRVVLAAQSLDLPLQAVEDVSFG